MICAAKIPALAAPALPIAMVATGMPAGICTVASKASRPLRLEESIGIPMTGKAGVSRDGAGQMRSGAGAADDYFQTALFGGGGVLGGFFRRAVRRHDTCLIGDAEGIQPLFRLAHDFEIGIAAH